MSQSIQESFLESLLSVISGYFVALAVWFWIITPWFGIVVAPSDNFLITGIFTVVSLFRGFIWRRIFNWWDSRNEV